MSDVQITRGSRILIILTVLLIIGAVCISFIKYFYNGDYLLYIKVSCDPNKDNCFIHECDSDDVRCSSLPDNKFYYKIIFKKELNAPTCVGINCPEVTCSPNEESCTEYFCSEDNLIKFDLPDTCIR